MGRGFFFARLLRSLAECLGMGRGPPPAANDTHRTVLVQWPCYEVPNLNVPDFESDTIDSYTCASHPTHFVGHLSSVASMIETTDRVCGDNISNDRDCRLGLFSENLKGVDTHREEEGEREMEMEREREMEKVVEMDKEKELGKKLAKETKREMQRKMEMQREMERVAMNEMTAARRRQIRARVAAAMSKKAREEREKAVAMTVSKQLEMEKERVQADAVGASLVVEEEAQQNGKAEKTEKVRSKKEKKKAKEMKRKARLQKVQSKGTTWQPVTMVKADEATMKAATLAAEEAEAKEVMERLRAAERAFGLRARGRAVGGGEGGSSKGERGLGESKCHLNAVVQGHGGRQSPKDFVLRGVQPKDCRWPRPPEALPTFSRRDLKGNATTV